MKRILSTLIFIIAVTGCSSYLIDSQDTTDNFYPPKSSSIDVDHLQQIARPHEVVGYVTVNTERRQSGREVIEKLKQEAAILGGDAITNLQSDSTGLWKKLPFQRLIGRAYVRANFRADVIVYK